MSQNPPRAFLIAVAAAASVLPFAYLMDATRAPGGDGLSGTGTMLLFFLLVLTLTIGGIVMGFRRKENHTWLALLALALWALPMVLMF